MITIDNPIAFNNFASKLASNTSINKNGLDYIETLYFKKGLIADKDKIGVSFENNSSNEDLSDFLDILNISNSGLKVMKGDSNFNNWQIVNKDNNDQIVTTNCNN